jgi:sodium transport system permease protein
MKRVAIIFQKETIDNLRDRRTLFSSFFSVLFTPALLLVLIVVLGSSFNVDPQEKALRLPVQGAEFAPGLVEFLRQNNVEVVPAPADPAAAVREGREDIIMLIPPEYPEAFRQGIPAPVQLVMDTSRQSATASMQRARSLLAGYRARISFLRLQARGIDPDLLAVISVGTQDVATPQSQALLFLNMMPFLLTLNIFSGGMGVIIDATAGERERGSLEPLLLNPARRWEFVLGKLLASLPFAVATLALVLVFFWLGFQIIPVEDFIGFPMVLESRPLLQIFLLALPEILLASALQMLIASFTRSFKEAQTYLSFLPLVIGLPGMFLTFSPVRSTLVKMLIPTYGQSLLFNQILRAEPIQPLHIAAATLSTLFLALLLILAAFRLYQGERVVFGK